MEDYRKDVVGLSYTELSHNIAPISFMKWAKLNVPSTVSPRNNRMDSTSTSTSRILSHEEAVSLAYKARNDMWNNRDKTKFNAMEKRLLESLAAPCCKRMFCMCEIELKRNVYLNERIEGLTPSIIYQDTDSMMVSMGPVRARFYHPLNETHLLSWCKETADNVLHYKMAAMVLTFHIYTTKELFCDIKWKGALLKIDAGLLVYVLTDIRDVIHKAKRGMSFLHIVK